MPINWRYWGAYPVITAEFEAAVQLAFSEDDGATVSIVNTSNLSSGYSNWNPAAGDGIHFLTVDEQTQKLFCWSDSSNDVFSTDFDGSNEAFITDQAAVITSGMGIDVDEDYIYLGDDGTQIVRYDKDGSNGTTLTGDNDFDFSLRTCIPNGHLYAVQNGTAVRRCNLDGSSATTVVNTPGGGNRAIDIDDINEYFFVIKTTSTTSYLIRYDLDGSNATGLVGFPDSFDYLGTQVRGISIDIFSEEIYTSRRGTGSSGNSLSRWQYDGTRLDTNDYTNTLCCDLVFPEGSLQAKPNR